MAQPGKLHALGLLLMEQLLTPPNYTGVKGQCNWNPGAESAKRDLLSGKVLGGDPGDGDLVVAKHQQPVVE